MHTPSGPTVADRPLAVSDALHAEDLPVAPWERDLRAAVAAARARRRRVGVSPDRPRERPAGHALRHRGTASAGFS